MPPPRIPRPSAAEYVRPYEPYVARIAGDDAWPELTSQVAEADRLLGTLSEDRALHRYAPGKWSVKQVVGHLCDNERVYAYRALRFGRGDPTSLSNFDENLYAETGRFDARPLSDLLDELRAVRTATLTLYRTFDDEALRRVGVARGNPISVRALVWVTAGHVRHHLDVLRERYGIS
jgi:hypothetical protein